MTINPALTVSIILFIKKPLRFASEVYCFCTKVTIVRIHNIVVFFSLYLPWLSTFSDCKVSEPMSTTLKCRRFHPFLRLIFLSIEVGYSNFTLQQGVSLRLETSYCEAFSSLGPLQKKVNNSGCNYLYAKIKILLTMF